VNFFLIWKPQMDRRQAARDLITNKRNAIQAQMNPADGDYSECYTQLTSLLYDFQNTLLAQEVFKSIFDFDLF